MTKLEEHTEKEPLRSSDSESHFSDMTQRLNLQKLGVYIRYGDSKRVLDNDNFAEREDKASSKLEKLIAEKCGEDTETVMDQVYAYASVIEEIYFNLGLKAGAILQHKLTDHFETDL